jgi:hypothetical protein
VGVANGDTGLTIIKELLADREFTYHGIDTCEHTSPSPEAYKRMKFIKGISFSDEIVSQVPELHWVFIDGCHCEYCVYRDAMAYIPKLKNKGMISFHDACPDFQGVRQGYKIQDHDPSDGVQVLRAIEKLDVENLFEHKRPPINQKQGGVISFKKQKNIPMM